MGPASAYSAVLESIHHDVEQLINANPSMFSFTNQSNTILEIRDFQTAGVVAFARGCPLHKQKAGKTKISNQTVQVKDEYLQKCIQDMQSLVDKL
ncbi:hypothetical protein KEM60_03149 [Austwickia sp. TVS 96-490-7B]|nr:hypothetical protein [Austwickia sp. TVS 96-490-7B]